MKTARYSLFAIRYFRGSEGMAGGYAVLRLDTGQYSHKGRQRSNNEDWLGSFQPEDPERLAVKGSLFLVADGMGGHQSGELASRRAADLVIRTYMEDPNPDVPASLRNAFEIANATLCEGGSRAEGPRRWGTTLVAAVVRRDELWIANVGDSRAYLLRGGKLRQLSRDHSWASAGSATALPENWIGRNIITRALGLKETVEVDLFPPVKLRTGDGILLCSDGLTVPLSDEEIGDLARRHPPQRATEALVKAANDRGGPDNVSVMLIRVVEQRLAFEWETVGELLGSLFQPETWRHVVEGLWQAPGVEGRGLRWPILIALILLVALVVVGVGFFLGLVLF
jgi:serine/threonine protein phosphatase PrpC